MNPNQRNLAQRLSKPPGIRRPILVAGLLAGALLSAGCKAAGLCDPEYAMVLASMAQAEAAPEPTGDAVAPVAPELAGPHLVERYIAFALRQNPDIQGARKRVEALANRVPQAASLDDPTLGVTFFPEQVQTAAGQQQFLLAASQRIPWFGKLELRAEVAEAEAETARAELVAVELEVIEQVKRAYYELYFLQRAIRITEDDRVLLERLTEIAQAKYRTSTASQQDVLRAEVETLNLQNELVRLTQLLASAQARLASLLHVSPETGMRTVMELPQEQIPRDIERLYEVSVAAQPRLHAQLAAVLRDQRRLELARLNYFPDVTAGLTWIDTADHGLSPIANGRDAFLLSLGINLPIYRNRLDAGVREAEAGTVASVRRYDSLRDRTLEEVKDLFEQVTSQHELVRLFHEDIVPTANQTLQVSILAYEAGTIDFLQLIDNWRQLLRFRVAEFRLEAQLRQSLASLERIVGGKLQTEKEAGAPDEGHR